jgi:hypothetical protein
MINYTNLDASYDSIVIFDMLSDSERKSNMISEKLETFIKQNKYSAILFKLTTKDELFEKLNNLLDNVKQGKKYMFHFVCHGNIDGIGFKHTNEFIPWKLLEDILVLINLNSNNSLVLNLTSCFGIHAIKTVNPFSSDKAFFGLIGYDGKLQKQLGIKVNERYYKLIMDGYKINDAIKDIVSYFLDDKFKCITSQGYSELTKIGKNLLI